MEDLKEIAQTICRYPLISDKSIQDYLKESGFMDHRKNICVEDFKEYLEGHKDLIDKWIGWSDKRTDFGWTFSSWGQDGYYRITGYGIKDPKPNLGHELTFKSSIDAVATYISLEMNAWAQFNENKQPGKWW